MHPDERPTSLHWDGLEPTDSSDDCPDCGRRFLDRLGDARSCWFCGYYRPAPPPDADILGLLGRGAYQRLRPRLLRMVRNLTIGTVVGQVNARDILRQLGRDLGANHGMVLEHHKVIDEATHMILLGEFAPEIKRRVLALNKPLRIVTRGRWLAPPGGWPKRPWRSPEEKDWPPQDVLEPDEPESPF